MDERDLAKASLLKALDLYKFTKLPYKSDDMCAENLEVEDFTSTNMWIELLSARSLDAGRLPGNMPIESMLSGCSYTGKVRRCGRTIMAAMLFSLQRLQTLLQRARSNRPQIFCVHLKVKSHGPRVDKHLQIVKCTPPNLPSHRVRGPYHEVY